MAGRDVLEYDIVIIGGGPSGLSAAIHIAQLAKSHNQQLSICLIDKASSIGGQIISGCVMNPQALNELIPNWRELNFPVKTPVTSDSLLYLNDTSSFNLPIPSNWQNYGNYIISLSQLSNKLGEYAESLGVEIYPNFAAKQVIIENNQVCGIITVDMGLNRDGTQSINYQAGVEIRARQTIVAEGCRGSIAQQIIQHFKLDQNSTPQTYGLGIKEIWRITPEAHIPGTVIHTIGYPLNSKSYGGGFVYHMADNLLAVGLVTALDYANPYLSPYDEFQRFKHHPEISKFLIGGTRLEYGARSVVEGGIQALPKLSFAGGILVGDSAGFLNVPKIKGVHNAIKSGMLGAQAVFTALEQQTTEANTYQASFKDSWLYKDLYQVRNIRPAFQYGKLFGILYTGFEKFILRGKAPWTLHINQADHNKLKAADQFKPITYPAYDNKISFDKASSLHLANISHADTQPNHLQLKNPTLAISVNLTKYASPETRYCPAGVYEIIQHNNQPQLQINAQNCIHCKACDIKDPQQNIVWTPPEGGSGPQYSDM